MRTDKPAKGEFTPAEWRIVESLNTPVKVQRYLNRLPYNWEKQGETLHSFRSVVRRKEAHCLEAALFAAVIMEQHGFPPLLLDIESQDKLDHVVFIFQVRGYWGSIARSRDIGLHGRKPMFRTIRNLIWSYFDPYVDLSARITGYGVTNLKDLGDYDWRFSIKNVKKVERHLRDMPHTPLQSSQRRYEQLVKRYKEFQIRHPGHAPDYFNDHHKWLK